MLDVRCLTLRPLPWTCVRSLSSGYVLMWLTAVLLGYLAPPAFAAALAPGDIVVLDIGIGGNVGQETIVRVDPLNGVHSVLQHLRDFDPTDSLLETKNIAVEQSGNLLVAEGRLGPNDVPALYRVDVATGTRSLLTVFDFVSPGGKRLALFPLDLAIEDSGVILVLMSTLAFRDEPPRGPYEGPGVLYRVDPVSGKATVLTDFAQRSGPDPLTDPTLDGLAVTVEDSGKIVVAVEDVNDRRRQELYHIDPATGNMTLFTKVPRDPQGNINRTRDLTAEATGMILVLTTNFGPGVGDDRLLRLNPVSGQFSDVNKSLGGLTTGLAVEADGTILVTDIAGGDGLLWRLDPVTGTQNELTRLNAGASGSEIHNPLAVAVVPARPGKPKPISIDVEPGNHANCINLKSHGKIVVAILTSQAFAASTVNLATVHFGRTGKEAVPAAKARSQDIDGDGDLDLLLRFNIADTGFRCGDTVASLTATTIDGQVIHGTDVIRTVGGKRKVSSQEKSASAKEEQNTANKKPAPEDCL